MAARVLVVEDNPGTLEALSQLFVAQGYRVLPACGGREALERLDSDHPDCMVLDYAMPAVNGLEVLHTLRAAGNTVPVVMLSAKSDAYDRVAGYGAGADVYVGKDEDPGVLLAVVRRLLQSRSRLSAVVEIGGLRLDMDAWNCTVDGRDVALPPRLFSLLSALIGQPGKVFRKEQLLNLVWGVNSDVYHRAVDNAVVELRHCLGDDSRSPRFVHTVRGIGYKFDARR
ncbi:MAG: response regulator transcription factor [Candidatus Dormibacteria bacterium]